MFPVSCSEAESKEPKAENKNKPKKRLQAELEGAPKKKKKFEGDLSPFSSSL